AAPQLDARAAGGGRFAGHRLGTIWLRVSHSLPTEFSDQVRAPPSLRRLPLPAVPVRLFHAFVFADARLHLDVHAVGEPKGDLALFEPLRRGFDFDEGSVLVELDQALVDGEHLSPAVENDVGVGAVVGAQKDVRFQLYRGLDLELYGALFFHA